jgi:hypothetical protein
MIENDLGQNESPAEYKLRLFFQSGSIIPISLTALAAWRQSSHLRELMKCSQTIESGVLSAGSLNKVGNLENVRNQESKIAKM